jgi:plasmid maintenance system antidote protein VapI
MDELIYKLGIEMKNQENPNSSQLIKFQKALTVSVIQELSSQLSDSEEFNQNLNAQLKQAMDEVDQTNEQILKYALSKSWQLTRPFRKLSRKFKRGA